MENLNNSIFGGLESERYGFFQCGIIKTNIYGYFRQHFFEDIEYYDEEKNELVKKQEINSEKFAFYLNFQTQEFALQSHSDANLPSKKEIINRFIDGFNRSIEKITITGIKKAVFGETRKEIINSFYNTSGRVTNVKANKFKEFLLRDNEFTWFNPDPKFPDAMHQSGRLFVQHTDEIDAKANQGGNLQKVPQIRYAVETSENPEITIRENNEKYILVSKGDLKVKINIPENQSVEEIFSTIIEKVEKEIKNKNIKIEGFDDDDQNDQLTLF